MPHHTSPITVVSILGYTRSGSTIFDNMLGATPGFFSAGELHYLWKRGLIDRRNCGCGQPVDQCGVWSRVIDRVLHEPVARGLEARDIADIQNEYGRTRHTLRLLHMRRDVARGQALRDPYVRITAALYRAIASVTGARVIIDSSKRASDGAIAGLIDGVEPYFVHLVRDPRAVVHSWRSIKKELDTSSSGYMPRQGRVRTALDWCGMNLAAEAVCSGFSARSIRIRYEDFASAPQSTWEAVMRFLGERRHDTPFLDERTLDLPRNHTVAGNPSRFSAGRIHIEADRRWIVHQSRLEQNLVSVLALPLLHHYGYPLSIRKTIQGLTGVPNEARGRGSNSAVSPGAHTTPARRTASG